MTGRNEFRCDQNGPGSITGDSDRLLPFALRRMSSARPVVQEYRVLVPCLPLYDSPLCARLATQAWEGCHFTVQTAQDSQKCLLELPHLARSPWEITLCEDAYQCWLAPEDVNVDSIALVPHNERYRAHLLSEAQIRSSTGLVIEFVMSAYKTSNSYLWGGTCGPNYDCSGLVQRAFAAAGIWIPRDAYQQESFVRRVSNHELQASDELQAGDLVFFGRSKATHVGIILEDALPQVEISRVCTRGWIVRPIAFTSTSISPWL